MLWSNNQPSIKGGEFFDTLLGGGTHALHGSTSPPPPPLSASPYSNLRGLVFNFINKKFMLLFLFSVSNFFLEQIINKDKRYKNLLWFLNSKCNKIIIFVFVGLGPTKCQYIKNLTGKISNTFFVQS